MKKEQLTELIIKVQEGDSEAANTFFAEIYNDVYYFALKTVKDTHLAEDITQESLIAIFNNIHSLNDPIAFPAWSRQVTYSQCTRYFRKTKETLLDENEDGSNAFDILEEDKTEFIPHEALDQKDLQKIILSFIDTLSPDHRTTVMLYYFDELSVSKIAEIQEITESAVKSRLYFARQSIKAKVEEYEEKTGTRLHAIAIFPFIKWIFFTEKSGITVSSAAIKAASSAALSGTSVAGAAAGTGAATTGTASVGTAAGGVIAKIAGTSLATKIVAGAVAAVIAVSLPVVGIISNIRGGDKDRYIEKVVDNVTYVRLKPEAIPIASVSPINEVPETISKTSFASSYQNNTITKIDYQQDPIPVVSAEPDPETRPYPVPEATVETCTDETYSDNNRHIIYITKDPYIMADGESLNNSTIGYWVACPGPEGTEQNENVTSITVLSELDGIPVHYMYGDFTVVYPNLEEIILRCQDIRRCELNHESYKNNIKRVVIGKEVENFYSDTFLYYTNLEDIIIERNDNRDLGSSDYYNSGFYLDNPFCNNKENWVDCSPDESSYDYEGYLLIRSDLILSADLNSGVNYIPEGVYGAIGEVTAYSSGTIYVPSTFMSGIEHLIILDENDEYLYEIVIDPDNPVYYTEDGIVKTKVDGKTVEKRYPW